MEGRLEGTMLGDKRPANRHQDRVGFFHAYLPTCKVPSIELVASVTQAVPKYSWGRRGFARYKKNTGTCGQRPGAGAFLCTEILDTKGWHRFIRVLDEAGPRG